jgi:hypothetical protein
MQYCASASTFVAGLVEGFVEGLAEGFSGAVVGSVPRAKRAQNSVDVRPEASIARRQASDAAMLAVVLVFTAAYLVRQSLTSASSSVVLTSAIGLAWGLWLVSGVADFVMTVRVTSDLDVGSGSVATATDTVIGVVCS